MNLKQFVEHIKAKKPLPRLIVLQSDDAYVIGQVLKQLRLTLFNTEDAVAIASQCQEEALRVSEAGAQSVASALTALQTLPMFAPRKLVVLREAEELEAAQEQLLMDYFSEAANNSGEAYLLVQYAKLRSNAKLLKFAEKQGLYIEAAVDKKPQFEEEIRRIAADKGLKLDPEIVRFLVEYVPIDLTRVEGELEKLALFSAKGAKIDLKTASELVCSTNLESVFRMTDAIGERNPLLALEILSSMLERGESPQMLLAMLARHMRHLYRVKMVERLRVSRDTVAAALETSSSFVIEKAVRQSRGFTHDGLRRAMRLLFEADRDMKSTSLPPALSLERLVAELCRMAGAAQRGTGFSRRI